MTAAVLAGVLLAWLAAAPRGAEGRGRPVGPWPALVALGAAGLLGTLVGAAMLAELIQRSENLRTAATAWGAPQTVGLSLPELAGGIAAHYFLVPGLAFAAALALVLAPEAARLAGGGAVRPARLHRPGPLGDPGPDRLGRAPLVLSGPAVPVAAQFLYRGGELNETAARRPELVLLSLAAVAVRLRRPQTA